MLESEGRDSAIELASFDTLEGTVRRALRQLEVWRERAIGSETERRRLQEMLDRVAMKADADPAELLRELDRLGKENENLRRMLSDGRRQAEKLAQEVEFLEDTR